MDWDQIIERNEAMDAIITTEKRPGSDDWQAYITGRPDMWAAGENESESIGNLWRTWFEEIVKKIREEGQGA